MDAAQIDLFSLAEKRLGWTEQRQALLSQNVANADTPGYKSRDVKSFDLIMSGASLAPTLTSPLHLTASGGAVAEVSGAVSERAPDGNAVALDKELAKVADTESTHELVTELYQKYQSMFRTALGR